MVTIFEKLENLYNRLIDSFKRISAMCYNFKILKKRRKIFICLIHAKFSDINDVTVLYLPSLYYFIYNQPLSKDLDCFNICSLLTVLSVTKAENDNDISIVEPTMCRDKEPEVFAFEIDEFGIPKIAENFELRTETNKNKFDVTDLEDFKKYQLLTEVFGKGDNFTYSNLVIQIKFAYKNQFKSKLGDNRAKELITDCKNNGWLLQEKPKSPYTLGDYKGLEDEDNIF